MIVSDVDRMYDLAKRTAQDLEQSFADVQMLQEYENGFMDMGDVRDESAENWADIVQARERLELEPAIPAHDENPAEGLEDYLERQRCERALEVYREGRSDLYSEEWEVTNTVIVLTTGGPHVQIEWDGGSSAQVVAWDWFGAGKSYHGVDIDAVFTLLGDMSGE